MDLNDKITGSTLTAEEWNELPSEVQNVIEGLGQSLSTGDLNQLGKSVAGYVANGTFYTDSGSANAYVLSGVGAKQTPTAYTNGLEAEFSVSNANSAASTVNVAGLGVKNITGTGGAGTLALNSIVRLRYNTGSGEFDIVGNTGFVGLTSADIGVTVQQHMNVVSQAEAEAGAATSERSWTAERVKQAIAALASSVPYTGIDVAGSSGYIRFIGGWTLQWGEISSSGNTVNTITLPISYVSSHIQSYASYQLNSVDETDPPASTTFSLSQIKVSNSHGSTKNISWFSIGV